MPDNVQSYRIVRPHWITDELWTAFIKVRRMPQEISNDIEFAIALRWFCEGYYSRKWER